MDEQRCKYQSKPCSNRRSLKDDGTLHRLCEFHRNKTKDAQRRWHARRRERAANRPEAEVIERRRVSRLLPTLASVETKKGPTASIEQTSPTVDAMYSLSLLDEELMCLWNFVVELDVSILEEERGLWSLAARIA